MLLVPSEDGFLTRLQETGRGTVMLTATDDLAISIPTIQEKVRSALGIEIRVFVGQDHGLIVFAREAGDKPPWVTS